MRAQRIFSIPPDTPFLNRLVRAVHDGTLLSGWSRNGPFWLADVTIVVPTRRARLALAQSFAARAGGTALLPDIRTFGGESEDEEPFLPPFDAPALAPVQTALGRALTLARLIESWVGAREKVPFSAAGITGFSSPPNPAEILALAGTLARLIDDMAIEGVAASALRAIAQGSLAENWQQTLQFLDIALAAWPRILDENGRIDAATHRNLRLERQAAGLDALFGDRPVIAAGSTGSIPATAGLLAAITRLERGVLVLPGLDTSLTPKEHTALCDSGRAPHGHPQYGLARLMRRLGARPDAVTDLGSGPAPRTRLVRRALALAGQTGNWARERARFDAPELEKACAGLAILIAGNEHEEARAVALAARNALAKNQSVGIVTPDRDLARRIGAELARYSIFVNDSAGTPLIQSRIGRLARLTLGLAFDGFAPVDLLGLLANRHVLLGRGRTAIARISGQIEMALVRGQHPSPGLAGLRTALAANLNGITRHVALRLDAGTASTLTGFLDTLETALAPLVALSDQKHFSAGGLATALAASLTSLREPPTGPVPAIEGGGEFAHWLGEATAQTSGPRLSSHGIDAVLGALMTGISVRSARPGHPGIAIWGRLEARLQSPDLMIAAGLNEGIWPEAADPGPWLSRGMRLAAGLEPPERQHGLAAHDFEQALGNTNILLTHAARQGTSPATPSRLIQRVEAFLGKEIARSLHARAAIWLNGARSLDATTGPARPAIRPAPKPAAVLRPRRLSFTEIETLFRSPYDIYARHVLGLKRLDPLGGDPGARERGTIIHDVLARFVIEGHDPLASNAQAILETLAGEEFSRLEAIPGRRDIWLRRFTGMACGFLAYERNRTNVTRRHAEVGGTWAVPVAGETFTLYGRADRIDRLDNGRLEIIDFKTGAVPAPGEMRALHAPQLPLEAAMAEAVGFEGIAPAPVAAMVYLKAGAGLPPVVEKPYRRRGAESVSGAADAMLRQTIGFIKAMLLTDDNAMVPHLTPHPYQRFTGDYDHLARVDEWTLVDGGDAP